MADINGTEYTPSLSSRPPKETYLENNPDSKKLLKQKRRKKEGPNGPWHFYFLLSCSSWVSLLFLKIILNTGADFEKILYELS
ncbi:MAG: hypothetical protein HOE90_08660 [Bacteriovoracaceae bacterium]|jgi:hypothetical protein|nr:hypothetical protein [Bacteriovoracaceae bacterium]